MEYKRKNTGSAPTRNESHVFCEIHTSIYTVSLDRDVHAFYFLGAVERKKKKKTSDAARFGKFLETVRGKKEAFHGPNDAFPWEASRAFTLFM